MLEFDEEKKEEQVEVENIYSDLSAMNIIHELAESTNTQATTHKKEVETNQLYAKANVLLAQTNNDLSRSIVNLNNVLSHSRPESFDGDKLAGILQRMEKQIGELMHKVEKFESVAEKIEKIFPSIIDMINREDITKKNIAIISSLAK